MDLTNQHSAHIDCDRICTQAGLILNSSKNHVIPLKRETVKTIAVLNDYISHYK